MTHTDAGCLALAFKLRSPSSAVINLFPGLQPASKALIEEMEPRYFHTTELVVHQCFGFVTHCTQRDMDRACCQLHINPEFLHIRMSILSK